MKLPCLRKKLLPLFFKIYFTCPLYQFPCSLTCHIEKTMQHVMNFFPLYPLIKNTFQPSFKSSNIGTCRNINEREEFEGDSSPQKKNI